MSSVQIKHVDPAIHDQLRARAAASNMPLGKYVLELIRQDLRKPPRSEWLESIRSLPRIGVDVDVVAALDTARDERDR